MLASLSLRSADTAERCSGAAACEVAEGSVPALLVPGGRNAGFSLHGEERGVLGASSLGWGEASPARLMLGTTALLVLSVAEDDALLMPM